MLPASKSIRTHHTPNPSPKRNILISSSSFYSTVPNFPHPSSPKSGTPYQLPTAGPICHSLFISLPSPPLQLILSLLPLVTLSPLGARIPSHRQQRWRRPRSCGGGPLLRPSPRRRQRQGSTEQALHPHRKTCCCRRPLPPQRRRIGGAGAADHASTAQRRGRILPTPSHHRRSLLLLPPPARRTSSRAIPFPSSTAGGDGMADRRGDPAPPLLCSAAAAEVLARSKGGGEGGCGGAGRQGRGAGEGKEVRIQGEGRQSQRHGRHRRRRGAAEEGGLELRRSSLQRNRGPLRRILAELSGSASSAPLPLPPGKAFLLHRCGGARG
jgi:hypothetical protein